MGISEEEFDSLMSGDKACSTPWESALLACEGLHLISENMKRMESLKKRNASIAAGIENFRKDIEEFQVCIGCLVSQICLNFAQLYRYIIFSAKLPIK